MAGSKSAAGKKKKQHISVSQEVKDVQAWVAGAPTNNIERFVKYVNEKRKHSSSRSVLLGCLYLLLKRPELAKSKPPEPASSAVQHTGDEEKQILLQLMSKLVQEAAELLESATTAAADGKKPSVVLAWATIQGLQRLADNLMGSEQLHIYQQITIIVEPFFKTTDLQTWHEQWDSPGDYPVLAEYLEAGRSAEQLVADLGSEIVSTAFNIKHKLKDTTPPDARAMLALATQLKAASSSSAVTKAASDNPKAATEKPKEEAKPKPKAAAKDSKAAAADKAAVKQQLEHQSPPKQQQAKRGKDTERARDAIRGKAGDGKAASELAEQLELTKAAKGKAEQVVEYLKEATLAGTASSPEAHIAALQSAIAIQQQEFKMTLDNVQKQLHGKAGKGAEAKASDGLEAAATTSIGELLKSQFGPVVDEKAVAGQLDEVFDKSSWMVFSESGEGQKGGYFRSLQDFREAAVAKQLDGKVAKDELQQWGMESYEMGPDLKSTFELEFGDLLQDDAFRELRQIGKGKGGNDQANGFHLEDNKWMTVFQEECPLRRYLLYAYRAITVSTDESNAATEALPTLTVEGMRSSSPRTSTATGFALLQLQRGQVAVAVEDLSTATDWQIKAYQCLKLLLPLNNSAVSAETLDFAVFNYYCDQAANAELEQMLDPDLFESPAAAGGAAGKAGGNSSSSSGPSFSGGLVQDSVTILGMLAGVNALVQGALPLAVQVYACKTSGKPLPLSAKQDAELKEQEVAAALQEWDRANQLELRSFLLQVLPQYFSLLQVYQKFLDAVVNKRWRRRFVPVVQQGKAGASRTYALSPDYYTQACMAAAMPYYDNAACCTKHIVMRELQEAQQKTFSKLAVDAPEDYPCGVENQLGSAHEDKARVVERYVIQTARVMQAQQEKKLHPATEKGLEALITELYLPSHYDEQVPQILTPVSARHGWAAVRFYLVLASQLAIQRQQLHAIIEYHEHRLQERGSDMRDTRDMRKAERGILQQRCAGPLYCYEAWSKWHKQAEDDLQEEMERLARPKGQAKGGKGVKEREQQDSKTKERLDQLHLDLEKAKINMAGVESRIRDLLREVDTVAAAAHAYATTTTDPHKGLRQALTVAFGELLDAKPPTEPLMRSRLTQALQLARMTLFELDCNVMLYACNAHSHALTTMWRHRQPAAAVVLLRQALATQLTAKVQEQRLQDLIEEDNKAQAASSKAAPASKKKKKKGSAAKKAVVVEKEPSEEEEEEEEAAAAAGSEGEEAAGQEGEESLPMPYVDPYILKQMQLESEQDHRTGSNHSSSSGSARAGAGHSDSAARAAKAAESALSKPPAKPGSREPKPPAARAAGDHHPQQQQQQAGKPGGRDTSGSSGGAAGPAGRKPALGPFTNVQGNVWVGPGPLGDTTFFGPVVCVRCGETDHPVQDCRVPHCSKCDKFGHAVDACWTTDGKSCKFCGRLHPFSVKCKDLGLGAVCGKCGLVGHIGSTCFTVQCLDCRRYGHYAIACGYCKKCQQLGHKSYECKARECPECHQYGKGCVVGRCASEQGAAAAPSSSSRAAAPSSSSSRAAAPSSSSSSRAAAPSSSSSSRAAAPRQPPASSSSGSGRAAAGAIPVPQNMELLDVRAVEQLLKGTPGALNDLANRLLATRGLEDFVIGLLGSEKLNDLLRVKKEDMDVWLQQKDAQRYLQGLLDHLETTRNAKPPAQQRGGQQQQDGGQRANVRVDQLPPAVAEWFEQQFPGAQLPSEWRSWSWGRVERHLEQWRGPQGKRIDGKDVKAVKRQAVARALAAGVKGSAGPGDGPRDSSSSSSAAASRQPSPPRQQQQHVAGEGASVLRERTTSHDSTGGMHFDEGASHADRHGSTQQRQVAGGPATVKAFFAATAPAGTAAGGGVRTLPGSAMEAVLQQKQKQLAAAGGQAGQQQQGPPGFAAAGQPQQVAPGASNSYATPNYQLSQQQQQQAFEQAVQLHLGRIQAAYSQIRDNNVPIEPWMLWLKQGAIRALYSLVPQGPEQVHLLRLLHDDTPRDATFTDMDQLKDALVEVLEGLRSSPQVGMWRNLGQLLTAASNEGLREDLRPPPQQLPAAAAPAAPAAAAQFMPPHLRTAGMAHLPPHMLGGQPGMGAAAAQPPLQQAAADDGDESSDDMDDMLGMLGVSSAAAAPAAAAAAQSHATSWEQVTGQVLEADTSAFPPLGGQPGDDSDMQQALAASRADVAAIAAASRGIRTVPGVSAAGLANQTGEYNCFLNVVVQCLWSCKAFTQQVQQLSTSMYDPHPVVEALLKLFGQMEEAETGWQPGRERPVIDPTGLRIALAEHTHFKCQEMNDANELLDTIYECFARSQHPGQHQGSRGILIDGVFGLLVTERVACRVCGRETHEVPAHYEHLIVVNSASLNLSALSLEGAGMDKLLAFLFEQEQKFCDKDEGGCGEPNPRYRELIHGPQVLTLQLVWDQQVAGTDIREALGHVEEDLDITRMYDVMQVASTTFRLTSAVAYYGQHYMAFVFNSKLNTWLMFDDASVSAVGTWQDVINKCAAGRIQPGVLFYRLVDLSSLPDVTRSSTPRHQQQQKPAHVSMPYTHAGSSGSATDGGLFGAPGGHHQGAAHHAAAGHGLGAGTAPAAHTAPGSSSSSSGLPASSIWGAKGAAQMAAAAGVDPDELTAAAAAQRTGSSGDTWANPDSSSSGAGHHDAWGSHSSTAAAGVTSGPSRLSSSSAGGWANSPMKGGAATGPAAAAGGSSSSGPPYGALGASALRGLGAQGGACTGLRTASSSSSSNPRGGPERPGGGYAGGPGGDAAGRGGRAGVGGRGAARGGRGDGDDRGWEPAGPTPGRGRGRGRGTY